MSSILLAFMAELGIITYRDLNGKDPSHTVAGLPLPADYLAAVAIFGALGMVPKDSPSAKVAGLFGWGIVIATYLNVLPGVPKTGSPANPATPSKTTTKGQTQA